MSDTHTVTRSSSSSMPASLHNFIIFIMEYITDHRPEQSDHDVPDLVHVDAAAPIRVERSENPVELVLGGVQLVHAVSLTLKMIPLPVAVTNKNIT